MGPIMRQRLRNRRSAAQGRRLAVESLETRALLTAVQDVHVPPLPVESLDVVFTEPLDWDASSVADAVTLQHIRHGAVETSRGNLTVDEDSQTLTWKVGTALPQGRFELRLDGSLLVGTSGRQLDGGIGGLRFQLPTFAASQTLRAGGDDLRVHAFSVPSLADWNSDGLFDLIVGQKTIDGNGKIGVYLNEGTGEAPVYGDAEFAQQAGADLVVGSRGCLGVFPRVFDWTRDGRKDLILGLADGRVQVFPNVGTDTDPQFGDPTDVTVGTGEKTAIDVGERATFDIVDWNNDEQYDLIAGGFDGRIRVLFERGQGRACGFCLGSVPESR